SLSPPRWRKQSQRQLICDLFETDANVPVVVSAASHCEVPVWRYVCVFREMGQACGSQRRQILRKEAGRWTLAARVAREGRFCPSANSPTKREASPTL